MLGNLYINYLYPQKDSVIDYEHKLSLNNAVISTKFIMGSTTFKREYFASHAHDVLVIRLSADKKNSISFKAALSRPPNGLRYTQREYAFHGRTAKRWT